MLQFVMRVDIQLESTPDSRVLNEWPKNLGRKAHSFSATRVGDNHGGGARVISRHCLRRDFEIDNISQTSRNSGRLEHSNYSGVAQNGSWTRFSLMGSYNSQFTEKS